MTVHAGKEGTVKIATDAIAQLRSWEITEEANTEDTTVMSDDWETHQALQNKWGGSCEAFWDESDAGQIALSAGASVTLNMYPEGADAGDTYYTGTATVTRITRRAEHDGMVEASFEFMGDGDLSETTV